MESSIMLFNPATNTEFKVDFYPVLNGKRYEALAQLESTFRNIPKEANTLLMLAKTNPDLFKAQFAGQADEVKGMMDKILIGIDSGEYTAESLEILLEAEVGGNIYKDNLNRIISAVKVMINDKQLPTELKELISLPINSDFWLEQDVDKMKAAANSFRLMLS